ncbi:MAG: type II toxin-antitoxin system VapC family toxin [Candidatus Hadarchaeales archaeon]
MAIFLDTCVLIAARNADDKNHARAKEIMRSVLKGEHGEIYTSDYVIDEAITLMLRRTRSLRLAIDMGDHVLSSPRIRKLWVTEDVFGRAWKLFKSQKRPMSFTDCTSLALMEKNGIGKIASFDSDFDGLVERMG